MMSVKRLLDVIVTALRTREQRPTAAGIGLLRPDSFAPAAEQVHDH